MKPTSIFQLLSLTTLAQSIPTQNDQANAIAFDNSPSLTSSKAATSPSSDIARRLGQAIVVNHCRIPIYIWSVGSTVRPKMTLLPYERYFETFREDRGGSGIAIKISTVHDGLYTNAPQTVFAYNLSGEQVWYDLSDVFGDPFQGHPVALRPAEPAIYWQNGVPPESSQVRVRNDSGDLVLTLC